MAGDTPVSFRLPPELLARVERHLALRRLVDGRPVTRTGLVIEALEQLLDDDDRALRKAAKEALK